MRKSKPLDKYFIIGFALFIFTILFNLTSLSSTSFSKFEVRTPDKKILLVVNSLILQEVQEAFHNCKAINNLNSSCYILQYEVDPIIFYPFPSFINTLIVRYIINKYSPDFAWYTSPLMLKTQNSIPTYGTLDVGQYEAVSIEENEINNTDLNWLKMFDGFVVYGNNEEWSRKIISSLSSNVPEMAPVIMSGFLPSIHTTNFIANSNHDRLFYIGINWDKKRSSQHFKELFKTLDDKIYFNVYGPEHSWTFLKKSYRGTISYDTATLLETISSNGIALTLHTEYHNKYGIPSKRIFEAAAAGAVIISDSNPFVENEFRDCVYYINPDLEPTEVVQSIDNIVESIQSNPIIANEKAYCAHQVFLEKFTLEKQWEQVFAIHDALEDTDNL